MSHREMWLQNELEKTRTRYRVMKNINFSLLYGTPSGDPALAESLEAFCRERAALTQRDWCIRTAIRSLPGLESGVEWLRNQQVGMELAAPSTMLTLMEGIPLMAVAKDASPFMKALRLLGVGVDPSKPVPDECVTVTGTGNFAELEFRVLAGNSTFPYLPASPDVVDLEDSMNSTPTGRKRRPFPEHLQHPSWSKKSRKR